MKQIAIISGKGGTGKTTIAASFASLAAPSHRSILVDCDVDAPNLGILLHPRIADEKDFYGMKKAHIDEEKCTSCGSCKEVCRSEAIYEKNGVYFIEPTACEGCGLCFRVCPSDAIQMRENVAGKWYISSTRYGPFVHAKLKAAEENSGKLVATIRNAAKDIGEKEKIDCILIDGPPGIGCPLISTVSGIDCVVIVFEPTLSGIQDAKRVIEVAEHFGTKIVCVINKYDINEENTEQIEDFCSEKNFPVLGKIPYDEIFEDALAQKKIIVEFDDRMYKTIKDIWDKMLETL